MVFVVVLACAIRRRPVWAAEVESIKATIFIAASIEVTTDLVAMRLCFWVSSAMAEETRALVFSVKWV